jgi:N-acetylmuramoyl-L-alanine amidase
MKIVISSGHGKHIRGAEGPEPWGLDEVDEARKVVDEVAVVLRSMGVDVVTFHDDVSNDQSENLDRIVDFHNAQGAHDWDVSVHFNAYEVTNGPMGTEVLYVSDTGEKMARRVVDSICTAAPFLNRGEKYRDGLAFLNGTHEPAILIEVCFVDSKQDAEIYGGFFDPICDAIGEALTGMEAEVPGPRPPEPEPGVLFKAEGKCSKFGGPNDTGVSPSEGLAFIFDVDEAPHLFLPYQPSGTSGLARRLNPYVSYVACRWDYDVTSKTMLRDSGQRALVRANDWEILAFPADWGPHGDTDRVADLSPGLMEALGITTDDEVEVLYPWPE